VTQRQKKIFCVIPIRKGSKGIKNKNIRNFNGKPLAYYTIKAAVESKIFSKIIVAHNSDLYKKKLSKFFKKYNSIFFYKRSEESSTDTASTESLILEVIKNNFFIKKDSIFFLIQATSPLLKAIDLIKAYMSYNKEKYDTLFTSYKKKIFIWCSNSKKTMKPYYHNPFLRKMKQDRKFFYIENGAFYIFKTLNFLNKENRIHGRIGTFVMPEIRSIEIDDKDEFKIAENLYKFKI